LNKELKDTLIVVLVCVVIAVAIDAAIFVVVDRFCSDPIDLDIQHNGLPKEAYSCTVTSEVLDKWGNLTTIERQSLVGKDVCVNATVVDVSKGVCGRKLCAIFIVANYNGITIKTCLPVKKEELDEFVEDLPYRKGDNVSITGEISGVGSKYLGVIKAVVTKLKLNSTKA